jgi:hypothetical protein
MRAVSPASSFCVGVTPCPDAPAGVFWGHLLDSELHMRVALMFGAFLATEVFTRIMAVLYTLFRMLRPPLSCMLDDSKRRTLRLGLACRLRRAGSGLCPPQPAQAAGVLLGPSCRP